LFPNLILDSTISSVMFLVECTFINI
jgi:hypothetical protein